MVGHVLKKRAVARVQAVLNSSSLYTMENTACSGTHTHSGPSGFLQHVLFQFSGSGFVPQTLEAMVGGIAGALLAAHADVERLLSEGRAQRVLLSTGVLRNASINRSPSAYLNNPASERALYDGDVDTSLAVLSVADAGTGALAGVVSWFAVHPTSMNNTNTLVSSDNKGMASLLLERVHNGRGQTARGPFVAAFASSNLGDASPNLLGARCRDTGEPCDFAHSTCPGSTPWGTVRPRNEQCSSLGPGRDMFESTAIIAARQVAAVRALLEKKNAADSSEEEASSDEDEDEDVVDLSQGSVDYRHSFVRFPGLAVRDWATGASLGALCDAAMGEAFAAGTIDGPGQFDFAQNATSSNPLWALASRLLHKATPAQTACQFPKKVLLPTGFLNFPNAWAPSVLPVQLLRIGSLLVACAPTELTAMAGRRLKAMLASKFSGGKTDAAVRVVIAGLSNEYADYTTTREEFQVQRYEGGSTIFGPLQLDAYLQEFARLADAMLEGEQSPAGPDPEDFSATAHDNSKREHVETPPAGADFGDVLSESWAPGETLEKGAATAVASFVGGDLKHDLKTGASFLTVQFRATTADAWTAAFVDSDPETRLYAIKVVAESSSSSSTAVEESESDLFSTLFFNVSVRFDVPSDAHTGQYRLVYHGDAKTRRGLFHEHLTFDGLSSVFDVA